DDFLVKPVDETLLHQSLTRVMEARLAEGAKLLPLLRDDEEELAQIFGVAPSLAITAQTGKSSGRVQSRREDPLKLRERLKLALRVDLPLRIQALDAARTELDLRALAELFHSLKGSLGFIWPEGDLVQLSAELERLADHNDWDAIKREIPRFRAMLMEIVEGADT
ncbi:MAG: Hpt domain-containing protein, partial [bacterium]